MNLAILGGTGLLGQHTAVAALERGDTVTLIGLTPATLLPALTGSPGVRFVSLDAWASSDADLRSALAGHDGLVYALGPDDREERPAPAASFFQRYLVEQTERIVTAARAAGVRRAVICGSYFATWQRMHPELNLTGTHPYVAARVEQARRAVAAGGGAASGGMDVSVLEIPYVFGTIPHQVPIWKRWLFDRLKAMPVVFYPTGGSSVVTAAQVGQAAAAAAALGQHDARYPLADEQLTWTALLTIVLPLLGKPPVVVPVPRVLAEPTASAMRRDLARKGMESGLDPRYLMRHVMYRQIFVDPAESLRVLGYRRGGVRAAIADSVAACYATSSS